MPQEAQTQQPAQQEQQSTPQQQTPVQTYRAVEMQPAAPPKPDPLAVLDNHAVAIAFIVVALVALVFYRPVARLIESLNHRKFKFPGVDVGAPGEQQAPVESGTASKRPEFQIIAGSPAVDEVRNWLSGRLNEFPDGERPARLLGFAAETHIRADFFRAYVNIYGSQLSLLRIANMSGGAVTLEVARRTFEEALARNTEPAHPFKELDQWLDFLKRCVFVETNEHAVVLTQRGKLFLHFMVEEGLPDFGLSQNLAKL